MNDVTPPPTSETFTKKQLVERHAHLLTPERVAWALRNRKKNGLADAKAVFESPCGELLIHEPTFLRWFLGLSGRAKPRSPRKSRLSGASAQVTVDDVLSDLL